MSVGNVCTTLYTTVHLFILIPFLLFLQYSGSLEHLLNAVVT